MLSFSVFWLILRGYVLGCFFLGVGKWCFLLRIFFLRCCAEYYLPGCFHIARHLAAESGTRCLLPVYMSSLLWVDDSQLELTLFFFGKRYFIMCRWYSFYKKFYVGRAWCGIHSYKDELSIILFFLKVVLTFRFLWPGFSCCWDLLLGCKWVYFIYRWFFGFLCCG